MDILSVEGFPQLSLLVADLYIPTQMIKDEAVDVVASRVRTLGHLGQGEKAQEIVAEVCMAI